MKDLLSFFTVFPVRGATLEEAAREIHLLPLIGLITGLPGAVLLLAAHFVPPGVASSLALGAVLLASGLHHADGVLDVGDAIMAHGSPHRRREVLEDTRVGVGGLGALFLVYAPTVGALAALCTTSPARAALALLAGEVAAPVGTAVGHDCVTDVENAVGVVQPRGEKHSSERETGGDTWRYEVGRQ